MKGKLVVFEGLDGCGKSTQIRLLKEVLSFALYSYPTDNIQLLRDYLDGKLTLEPKSTFLLFLSDIAEQQPLIREEIKRGKLVVLDRYVFSTVAYELGPIGYERSKRIVEEVGFLRPDIVFLLDISPRIAQERKKRQKKLDRYESDLACLKRVRRKFLALYQDNFFAKRWYRLNGEKDAALINKKILKVLR